MDFLVNQCMGCDAQITPAVGVYYCDPCIARQTREQAKELAAFDAFHDWADRIARSTR